jgi:hypothetical protein
MRHYSLQKEYYEHVSCKFSTQPWHWPSDEDADIPPGLLYNRLANRHQCSRELIYSTVYGMRLDDTWVGIITYV